MNELTLIRLAILALPTLLVVVILLDLLTEEYLRLMELAGLVRRRSPVRVEPPPDARKKGLD